MTPVQRLVANGNAIINFLKEFSSSTPKDVNVDWIADDDSIQTQTFANIKKFQDGTTSSVNAAIANFHQANVVFSGWSASHGQAGATYQRVPYSWQPIPAKSPYCTVANGADTITINKAGQYLVLANIMKHKNNVNAWGHTRILHNGSIGYMTHERHYLCGSWQSFSPMYASHFNAGDTVIVDSYQAGSNPYNFHSAGQYGCLWLIYLGD
jgi:hypothetical protein